MATDRILLGAAAIPEPEQLGSPRWSSCRSTSVWQGGHVLSPRDTGEAITRLALLTAWTERVRVGTAVLVLPLYHPVVVAKQIVDLDARSGGRVSVGIGVGGDFPQEFEAVGVPLAERGARTDEAMDVMRALWTGEPVTHHGRFFDLDGAALNAVGGAAPAGRPAAHRVRPQAPGDAAGGPARATVGCRTSCRPTPTPARSRG